VIGQAEARADGLGRKPLDEESVQGRETPMQGLRGFEEEAATSGIVHDRTPG
jgi:hypothetical protein